MVLFSTKKAENYKAKTVSAVDKRNYAFYDQKHITVR